MKTQSFRQLIVWQKSRQIAILIYRITEGFPKSEVFGLSSQMRRCAISISSNIAESYNRFQPREKRQFLVIAYGSVSELESQIDIAAELFPHALFTETAALLVEIGSMLNKMISTRF